jgi:O-antigen ligase
VSQRRHALALSALAFAALLVAAAVLYVLNSGVLARDEPPVFIPWASDKVLGINADLSGLDPGSLEQALTDLEDAGFRWLRQRFPWDAIEASPGEYEWSAWDAVVEGAIRHNLALIAALDGSPAWARAEVDAENPLAPPTETRYFGDFASAFAERYGDQVDLYQIWDEPNIAPHWGGREIDPAAYARLLREGAIRIRAVDTNAVVLLAALAPNVESGGENLSDLLFLDAVYNEGASEWFDLASAQPYAFGASIDAQPGADKLNWRRVELLRGVMESHGDAATGMWATSFGVPASESAVVSEAVEYARKEWPWMGAMLWAAWAPEDAHGQYALSGADGDTRPALDALKDVAQALDLAWPGAYLADHASGQYQGDWRATPSGADIGTNGDRLVISFYGTRLDLVVRRGDYRAFLFAQVDGRPANALPIDTEGQAYIVLYDPLNRVDKVTLARGLSDGNHVAEIEAERGWGQWAIVGWVVSREAPRGAAWIAVVLGLGAMLGLGVAVFAAWPTRYWLLHQVFAVVGWYRTLDERVALFAAALAAVLLYVMVGTLPVLVMLGVLALLLMLRPDAGLPLIVFALPFHQLGRPMLGKVFSMVEILLALTAVGWGIGWLLGRWARRPATEPSVSERVRRRARLAAADWGVVVLVALGACSLLWAEQGREAAREFRTVVLEAGIFYGLLRAMLPRLSASGPGARSTWLVVDAWLLGGALIAMVGLGQWAFGQNLITADGVGRVRGFYGSPNNLALYLGRLLPLAVTIAVWGKAGRRRWVYGLALVLMGGALMLTYSRGAWIVGVPASLLFLAAMRGRRTLAVAVGVLVVLAVIVLLVVGPGRLTSLLDTSEGTTFFRLQLWRSSFAMIGDHPLMGVGLDNFLYAYRSGYVLPTAWEEFDLSHPHNFFLDFWLRLGIAGLAAILFLLGAFYRKSWGLYRRLPEGDVRLLVLGLMAGMVNFVAHGLVDNAFFLVDLAFVFMLMLALVQSVDTEDLAAVHM